MNKFFKLGVVILGLLFYQGECFRIGSTPDKVDLTITPSGELRWCGYSAYGKIKEMEYQVSVSFVDPNTGQNTQYSVKRFLKNNDWKESDGDSRVFRDIDIPTDGREFMYTIIGRMQCSKCADCPPPAFEGQGIPFVAAYSSLNGYPDTFLALVKNGRICSTSGGTIMDCN